MSVSILIPFREDFPERGVLLDKVIEWYQCFFPDAELIVSDSDEGAPFNRSAARNNAFRSSTGDVIIIADADTLFVPTAMDRAIRIAERERVWALPYDDRGYYNLTQEYTQYVLNTITLPPREHLQYEHELESWAGALVMRREAYEIVGGYNESFIGWGYEDNAFRLALETLWGPLVRTEGWVTHMWHWAPESVRFEQPDIERNRQIFSLYQRAYGNVEAMMPLRGSL